MTDIVTLELDFKELRVPPFVDSIADPEMRETLREWYLEEKFGCRDFWGQNAPLAGESFENYLTRMGMGKLTTSKPVNQKTRGKKKNENGQ